MWRPIAGALLALLFVGAFIARLRRIERPYFDPVQTFDGGRVRLGRVRIARRGETGRNIGWLVRCDRREVWHTLGNRSDITLTRDPNGWQVHVGSDATTIASTDCPP